MLERKDLHRTDVSFEQASALADVICKDLGLRKAKVRIREPEPGVAGYYSYGHDLVTFCGTRYMIASVLVHELGHHVAHCRRGYWARLFGLLPHHGRDFQAGAVDVLKAWERLPAAIRPSPNPRRIELTTVAAAGLIVAGITARLIELLRKDRRT